MTLSASQTGVHTGGGSSVTATMTLSASSTATSARSGTRTAAMTLAATRVGAKGLTATRTATMVLTASITVTRNNNVTRTATMTLTTSLSGTTHTSGSSRTAAMVLSTGIVTVHTSGSTATAPMVLSASVTTLRILGPVATPVKAAVLVRYELVCVARIPQTNGAPTLLQVDPIDWTGLSYVDELSKPQQLNAGAKITSLTEPILQRLRDLAHNPMELWLYRNSKLVFAGPLFGWQVQGTGQAISLQAAGLLGYTQLMEIETDTTFNQVDQFTIASSLINAWQNTPYGNFGIDTTSVGASGVLRDATYLAKEQNTVAKRLEELGKRDNGFDMSVDPTTRKLQLAYPTFGVDRSVGEDAIVFDERNITNPNVICSCAPGDVASDAFGTGTNVAGADPTYSTQWSDDLRARYGRSAVASSFQGVSEQATLDAYVQGLLDVRQSALMIPGPDVRVTPDTDLSLYDVGDTVFYRLHSQLGLEGGFRLRKRTVTVKTTGQESVSLAFA